MRLSKAELRDILQLLIADADDLVSRTVTNMTGLTRDALTLDASGTQVSWPQSSWAGSSLSDSHDCICSPHW